MKAADLAARVTGAKPRGNQWIGRCPAHDDQRESLSFKDGDKAVVIKCHAGCDPKDICEALGVKVRELFFDSTSGTNGHAASRRIVATYDYHDAAGVLLYQAVRFEPKDFRQRRPDGHGDWIWDLHTVCPVAYHLPDLAGQPRVYNVEGEKDVDRLRSLGLAATCNSGGAGKWTDAHTQQLKAAGVKEVITLPDNDDPGRKHAQSVARSCVAAGLAAKIVTLPNLPPKGDVSDYFDAGGTVEELQALVEAAPGWMPDTPSPPADRDHPIVELNCSDAGNGRRFATQHRGSVHWCPQWKSWLNYDGTRWRRDTGNTAVMRCAKQTARSILDEARQTEDDDRRRKLVAWAVTSESVKHLAAMVELAKSEEGILIEPTELDRDGWLFNAENGTIDLRTGTLLPHDRHHLITKLTPIVYTPHAHCPTWIAFLTRIMNTDDELIAFLQTATGYSLTASVREQVLFLLHGGGANGKSTLIRMLLALLGDYGLQTPSETLLISRQDGGVRNDLARLAGARVVAALESDGGRKLAPALIKQLTGNDIVTARFLFSEHFEIVPSWKVWFSTNHKPSVPDDGDALWRRLRLIPFSIQIPECEQDKELLAKLTNELPGILAWAVQGCLRWQRDGLRCPAVIEDATASYREAESTFEHFLQECCVRESDATVKFAELRTAYTSWTEESSDKPMSSKMFAAALSERGFQPTKQHNARCYRGLRLRTISDDLAKVQTPVGATQGEADVDFDA